MDFGHLTRRYDKELPGADIEFQPSDIRDYADDEWDIRISIGDAPLEEAYYFTVDDPNAVRLPIANLLESYALNPELSGQLDIAEYPDLPFLQEELRQYWENSRNKRLELDFFVNKNRMGGPVNLSESAERYLSVCTYHDGSHDYRVLDLILETRLPEAGAFEIDRMRRRFSNMFLLMLIDYHREQGPDAFSRFLQEKEVKEFLQSRPSYPCIEFANGMKQLEGEHLINVTYGPDAQDCEPIVLTDSGEAQLDQYKDDFCAVADNYDCFDSVAIAPPALGVPGGFDARIQMMEYDGLDCEEAVMLQVLGQDREQFFALGQWQDALHDFTPCNIVMEALAFKTNFSGEVMAQLRELGGIVEGE